MKTKHIVAFLNSYTHGKSGGDICFIEIFKQLSIDHLSIMTTSLGRRLCKSEGLQGKYIITTQEKSVQNIVWLYIKRIGIGVRKAFTIKRVDIIYTTSDALPDVIPALILKLRFPRSNWVSKIFHIIPKTRIISSLSQQLSHYILKHFADKTIADNKLLAKELNTLGFNRHKITINYPGFSTKKAQSSKIKYEATFMSRIHESKGVFDLIRIWRKVVNDVPYAKLGIIGVGDLKTTKKLKALILELKLKDHVTLFGYLSDSEAFSLISASQMFLFPSHEEGFAMTVGEVLSCKVPVIAYELPVFEETVKPVIISVPCFDEELFSWEVIKLLQDTKSYKLPTKHINTILKSFSWESAVEKEKKILKL